MTDTDAEIYEVQRKKLDEKLNGIITSLLEPECSKYLNEINDKYVYRFLELFFSSKGERIRIFELFMSDKIYRYIQSKEVNGYFDADKYIEGRSYIEEVEDWVEDLFYEGGIRVNLIGLNIYDKIKEDEIEFYWDEEPFDYSRYIKEHSKEIKEEIYFSEDYIKYYKSYDVISKELLNIENLMQDYIKELLIPNYRLKKLLKLI